MSVSMETSTSLMDSDSDEEIAHFVPPETAFDLQVKATLDKASLTVPESEEESTGHTPGVLTPQRGSDSSNSDNDDVGKSS